MSTPTKSPPQTTGHPAKEIETAKKIGDLIAATTRCRDRETASADRYYAAGDAVYTRIRGTKRWTLRIDKVLQGRELRKIYYDAASHVEEAARLLGVAIYREQAILAEAQRPAPGDFDPTK